MALSDTDNYKILINTEANTSGIKQAESSLNTLEGQSKKTTGAFSSLTAQFALGNVIANEAQNVLSGLTSTFKHAFDEAMQMQSTEAQLNNALKTTKDASGQSSDSLNTLAEKLEKNSTFSKLTILQAEQMALTYTKIGKDTFPGVIQAAADLSTRMGMDLPQATKLLSVALSDPEASFGRLKKAGVVLSDQQKQTIKDMQKTGDVVGAQKYILNSLEQVMGNSAKTASQTFGGAMKKLSNIINTEIAEAIIKAIGYLNKFTEFAEKHKVVLATIAGVITGLAIAIGVALAPAVWGAVTAFGALALSAAPFLLIGAAVGAVAYEIITHWQDLKQWYHDFIKDVKDLFDRAWHDIDHVWQRLSDDIKKAWDITWKDIKRVTVDVVHAIGLVLTPFYDVFKFIFETIYAIAVWAWQGIYHHAVKPTIDAIENAMKAMLDVASKIWNTLYSDIVKPVFDRIVNGLLFDWHIIDSIWQAIWDFARPIFIAIGNAGVGAWHMIVGVWQGALKWFESLFHGVSDAGSSAAHSISNTFSSIWGDIKNGTKSAINEVIDILDKMIRAYNDTVGKIPHAPKIPSIPKFASGTNFAPGGLALVGEQGPELVNLPTGSQVIPAGQTQDILNKTSNTTVTIGTIVLNNPAAAQEFFHQLNQDTLNLGRGLTAIQGKY